ncbi:MAG: hypothetical protein AAFZ52_02805, partial [Bacteroidota bacterium]
QMKTNRLFSLLPLLLLPLFGSATSIFDLLYQGEEQTPVRVTLLVPMDSLLAKVPGAQKSTFIFEDHNGQQQAWSPKVSVRGKFRRNRCEFAPLKLDFSKKDLKAAGLAKHDKYKLVTPCSTDPKAGDLILKEYLAYRTYALLTNYHFRVQLLEITYVDADGKHPKRTETAFLIEDADEMAERYGATELEDALGRPAEAFAPAAEISHALMQYLIGNGDWSLPLARNLKIIELPDGKLAPVGYDFDFSGWVGAPYASPSSDIGQQSIYERVYLGYAQEDKLLRQIATEYREKRRPVINLIRNSKLEDLEKEILLRWTGRFFAQLNRMNKMEQSPLYDLLRGDIAEVIPPGAEARSFRSMGK